MQLHVELGDDVVGVDSGIGHVTGGSGLDHVSDGEPLDRLVLRNASVYAFEGFRKRPDGQDENAFQNSRWNDNGRGLGDSP